MLQPLAISVIGGLLSSMVLSLVFTPAIQFFLQSKQDRTPPTVEPTLP
jgi:Cu/Ag efflux pump CusA